MAWIDDLSESMDVFNRLVKPVLPKLITGKYISVEGTPEEIAHFLDEHIGIDAMVDKETCVFGLGSRIQIDSGVWNTFTIRCERESGHITELEKLRNAIKYDSMRPQFSLHAYVVKDELKSIAIARTKDIIEYLDTHDNEKDCPTRKTFDKKTHKWQKFRAISWKKMKEAHYQVIAKDFRYKEGSWTLTGH